MFNKSFLSMKVATGVEVFRPLSVAAWRERAVRVPFRPNSPKINVPSTPDLLSKTFFIHHPTVNDPLQSSKRISDSKTIDKYVNAYFSYRVATRRHSFMRPNNRSITLRSLYRSASNGNAAPVSFALYGITASIPSSERYCRIAPDENALSPEAQAGLTGSAFSSEIEIPCKTGTKNLLSCFWPAHNFTERPWMFRSAAAMILVVGPPRERPMAWSSGSPFFWGALRRRLYGRGPRFRRRP